MKATCASNAVDAAAPRKTASSCKPWPRALYIGATRVTASAAMLLFMSGVIIAGGTIGNRVNVSTSTVHATLLPKLLHCLIYGADWFAREKFFHTREIWGQASCRVVAHAHARTNPKRPARRPA